MVGFAMSFNATTWVQDLGFFNSFAVYSGALGVACLGLPLVYFYGKRIRAWTAGRLEASVVKEVEVEGGEELAEGVGRGDRRTYEYAYQADDGREKGIEMGIAI